jgi:hypothetical protein
MALLILSFLAFYLAGVSLADIQAAAPPIFTANPSVGGGQGSFKDSAHFRVYGAADGPAEQALKELESSYTCFVEHLGWRSSGLSKNKGDDGPWMKTSQY